MKEDSEKVIVIDHGKNYLPEIKEIWAFVSVDENGEGIISQMIGGMWMPLVGADVARVNQLRPLAEKIARKTGKTIRLIKLSNREIITTIIGGN